VKVQSTHRAREQEMTREAFRAWARTASKTFAAAGRVSTINRAFAERIRHYDAELADLYVRLAVANEAIRAHLLARAGR
jgi:hypothetical protein